MKKGQVIVSELVGVFADICRFVQLDVQLADLFASGSDVSRLQLLRR
jgi:hypothetical protein